MSDVSRLLKGRFGETEVLVTEFADGSAELALRSPADRAWSPPTVLHEEPA